MSGKGKEWKGDPVEEQLEPQRESLRMRLSPKGGYRAELDDHMSGSHPRGMDKVFAHIRRRRMRRT